MFKIEAAMETWLGEEKETETQTKMQRSWDTCRLWLYQASDE